MWDCDGLEYIGDITADDQRMIVESLKGNDSPRRALANPHHLRLRAQFNPQRHYEIYFVEAVDGISTEDIREMFLANPQTAADTIRQLGTVFYSNRVTRTPTIV